MSQWDEEYITLCKKILSQGVRSENRTGTDTIKIPAYFFGLDTGKEFPVLTTKQLFFKAAILEMLWIYKAQSNDVRWLQERNVHIWDEWEIGQDGIWRAKQMMPGPDGKLALTDVSRDFGTQWAHTIGTAYGWIVKKFGLTDRLIDTLINNPADRRMVISLWQDEYVKTAVLPSCVWSSEWDVTGGKLNVLVHQRSCDVPLGLPFNVTQYACLLRLMAHCSGLEPGMLYWSIKDAHIYVNQTDGIKEQIKRFDENGSYPAPKFSISDSLHDFYDIDDSRELSDIKIEGYRHMGKITFPIAT